MPLFLVLWLDFYEMILTKVADHADAVWVILWLLFCFNACELNIWPNGIWKCDNKHTGLTKMHNANKIISTKNKTGAQLFKNLFSAIVFTLQAIRCHRLSTLSSVNRILNHACVLIWYVDPKNQSLNFPIICFNWDCWRDYLNILFL